MKNVNKFLIAFAVFTVIISVLIIGTVIGRISTSQSNSRVSYKSTSVTDTIAANSSTKSTNKSAESSISTEQEKENDFRQAQWGMSKESIKKLESFTLLYEADDMLLYDVKLEGLPGIKVNCGYLFNNDIFFRGTYTFKTEHTNQNDYIHDFETIKKLYTQKYGKSKKDNINWKNTLYKDSPQEYGFAVSMGHLNYFTYWEIEDKIISLALKGDNYKIDLESVYWNKKDKSSEVDLSGF